jgi:hypothetical protein
VQTFKAQPKDLKGQLSTNEIATEATPILFLLELLKHTKTSYNHRSTGSIVFIRFVLASFSYTFLCTFFMGIDNHLQPSILVFRLRDHLLPSNKLKCF